MNDQTRSMGALGIVGGALLVIGSFLPWVKIDVPIIGTITRSGMTDKEGIITVVLGAAAVVCALQVMRSQVVGWAVGLLVAGGLAAAVTALEFSGITAIFHYVSTDSFGLVSTSYGIGLLVVAIGVAAVLVSAIRLEMLRRATVGAAPPPAPA